MKKIIQVLFLVCIFFACKKSENVNPTTDNNVDVYVAGGDSSKQAKYWKNGIEIVLPNGTEATSIFVSGNDVYVSGNSRSFPKYWKNGIEVILPDGSIDGSNGFVTSSIFVSGNDVYVSGTNEASTRNGAYYWKNGIMAKLTGMTIANSIAVAGNDVYVVGIGEPNPIDEFWVGVYWKNNKLTTLSDSLTPAIANSIAIVGNDVYIGGAIIAKDSFYTNQKVVVPAYWKNGNRIALDNKLNSSYGNVASCIAVEGNDVYVGGYGEISGGAILWKNGVATKLPGGNKIFSIAISGSDVYAVGNGIHQAMYWKNGQEIILKNADVLSSIFIVPK